MEMTLLERDDGIAHVVLAGRLDTTAAEQLDQRFSEATAARNRPAIVDLSSVEFMASRGIGLLLANGKRLKRAGHQLVLVNPQGMVAGVLKTSKADLLMPIVPDLEAAVRVLGGKSGTAAAAESLPAAAKQEPSSCQPSAASTAVADVLSLPIKNELAELDRLNAAVAEFLAAHSVPYRAAYAVNLAIEELIVNVIRYAYIDDETHVIEVELALEGEQIVLRIVDDGMPFDPRKGPALNLHAEDREIGGLGLILVLDMVDVLKYRRVEDRNRVEVRIHLAAEAENSGTAGAASDPAQAHAT